MSEPLVFIPGLNCTPALYAPQAERFGHDRPIVFADNRQDATIAAMAGRLLGQAPARFALAGLSMGGYVALEIMRLAPHRVSRLALLDTSARPDTEDATIRRRRLMGMAEEGAFQAVHDALWGALVHPSRRQDGALESIVKTMMLETGPEAFVRQQRAIIGRADSRPFLKAIAAPTLIVVGEGDAITPPDKAEELQAGIEGAELVVVPDCGHLSTLEQPERVNEALGAWLAR
jgi:pimeloyl-ACP methyl ester carboxylesterase